MSGRIGDPRSQRQRCSDRNVRVAWRDGHRGNRRPMLRRAERRARRRASDRRPYSANEGEHSPESHPTRCGACARPFRVENRASSLRPPPAEPKLITQPGKGRAVQPEIPSRSTSESSQRTTRCSRFGATGRALAGHEKVDEQKVESRRSGRWNPRSTGRGAPSAHPALPGMDTRLVADAQCVERAAQTRRAA